MVVLDYIPFELENQNYPMATVVDQLHRAEHPKLVIAYIDIGEAESYRTYWVSGWEVGDPEWIVGEDPDGWAENYPVAYWHDPWRDIWLGDNGVLTRIVRDGFDGVYLDWVEAYSDENVMDMAREEGVDPVQEMIWWVGDIRESIRSKCADCVVIGQNAVELVEFQAYREVIDAVSQEQVWFDGGADNDPPGDCPLPRLRVEVDTETYRESLSPRCQKQYDEYPESTLHVSSEEYLEMLFAAQEWGIPVFTVDYALDPDNVGWVYDTARDLGFIPFVGPRGLDQFLQPWP
jgi:cysteinyl-tRNA synthetase